MQYFKRRFKMKRFIIFISLLIALTVFLVVNASAQATDTTKTLKVHTFANAGLVNQYLWRGTLLDNKPNIQPILGMTLGSFEIGTIGSLSVLNNYYEADLYASYTYKLIKLSITDFYFDLSGPINNQNYFDYSKTSCYHHFLCDLIFQGTEKFPVKITASTLLNSGWDLYDSGKKKYTSYFEAKYFHKKWEMFIGAITKKSDFYQNKISGINVVNVGAAYNYSIDFSKSYSLPSVFQLCVNPQMEKIYFTFGVTF